PTNMPTHKPCSTRTAHSLSSFSFSCSRHHRHLHSFPTRRSSDLVDLRVPDGGARAHRRHDFRPCLEHPRDRRVGRHAVRAVILRDRKSTRLNSSHVAISYAVFCLKKKNK